MTVVLATSFVIQCIVVMVLIHCVIGIASTEMRFSNSDGKV